MNDILLSSYVGIPLLILLALMVWMRYTGSVGKRSQKALAQRIESLQNETTAPLFVCMYGKGGHGILVIDDEGMRLFDATTELFRLRRDEIMNVEYSDFGFSHIVTATDRYKLAYIHYAQDAKGAFTMTFGPAYRDDEAIKTFVETLERARLPHTKVAHSTLLFLPRIKY